MHVCACMHARMYPFQCNACVFVKQFTCIFWHYKARISAALTASSGFTFTKSFSRWGEGCSACVLTLIHTNRYTNIQANKQEHSSKQESRQASKQTCVNRYG